jgi:hypothetical protein
MKKFILALLIVMLASGAAYAVEAKIVKGAFHARGNWEANPTGTVVSDAPEYGYYDQELEISLDFVVDETTKVVTLFEITDQSWLGYNKSYTSEADDNIEFKRVYLDHQFSTGTILDAGKMSGGTWGTTFNDNEGPAYRVKVTQMFPWGLIVGLVQKNVESGANAAYKDEEKDDSDTYVLGAVINAGPVAIMPAFLYVVDGSLNPDGDDDDLVASLYWIAVTGNFGMIGFEAEYAYQDYSFDDTATGMKDYDLSGFYANVWANFEAFKIGGIYAWGSYDEDTGARFNFGDDFDKTLTLCDLVEWGTTAHGLGGMALYQIYADFAFGKFSLSGAISYVDSNHDAGSLKDASAFEYDVIGAYKITDNLTYEVGVGVASIDLDQTAGGDDPEDPIYAYHMIKVSF